MYQNLELWDIQRLLISGLRTRPFSAFAMCTLVSPAQTKLWLEAQLNAGRIPNATPSGAELGGQNGAGSQPQLFVAFTYAGLEKLADGALPFEKETFVPEFRQGMTDAARARVIGDRDTESWHWGAVPSDSAVARTAPIHMLCAVYARRPSELPSWLMQTGPHAAGGFDIARWVRADFQEVEHFGFRDGISQPYIEGSLRGQTGVLERDRVPAGEFILGYRNIFHQLPASPTVRARPAEPPPNLPLAPLSTAHDLGKNGSFLVVRELEQHVEAFADLPTSVRAGMIGRWPNGKPLVTHPVRGSTADRDERLLATGEDIHGDDSVPIAGEQSTSRNDFTYFAKDAAGVRCPLGAHIRRANPRDALTNEALGVSPQHAILRANEHRILRRSRLFDEQGCRGRYRGTLFMCFNTNLERQFEFVQQTWVNNPKFSGPRDEVDPLLGGSGNGSFTRRAGPDREVFPDLSRYVSMRGGAYFFMPGLRALRYLVRQWGEPPR